MSMEEKKGSGSAVLLAIVIGIIGLGLGFMVGNQNLKPAGKAPSSSTSGAAAIALDGFKDSEQLPIGDSPIMGNPAAPVTIVEFTSMQCPFCGRAAGTLKELVEKRPDDVRVVFKHFPLAMQAQAEPASRAVVAAGNQGKTFEMKDILFDNLSRYREGNFDDLAVELAGKIGLDVDKFKADYAAPETAQIVARDLKLGEQLGVRGTPHFFVNGEVVNGAQPYDHFSQVVDNQLKKIEELRKEGVPDGELYAAAIKANLGDRPAAAAPSAPAAPETEVFMVEVRDTDAVRGADADKALVTIMEFSSFQCPFCARGSETLSQLADKYGDQVRFVFKHFPLSFQAQSEPAARAAVAAGNQGKFWEMYDQLYANQRALGEAKFEEIAQELGLNMDRFKADYADSKTAEIVKTAQRDGQSAGIRGTPGFLINGIKVVGAQPLAVFENHVKEQIEIAEKIKKEKGLSGDELYKAIVEYNKENAGPAAAPAAAPPARPQLDGSKLTVGDSYTKGPANAPVTIYEFSSFQCPFCARGADTLKQVAEEYGDKVRIVYKNFPLPFQAQSEPAARAALAAGEQGKFWEFYEQLYANQRRFSEGDKLWEEIAQNLGLNMSKFKTDFASEKIAEQVKAEQGEGRAAGVTGTPAFFINGESLSGAQPIERFREVIDRKLEG